MAHFAKLDENNTVTDVVVVPDDQESRGQDFLSKDLGLGGAWIQTSYSGKIRKRYAGVGMQYDATRDVFLDPQPFPSWTLDSDDNWNAPVPYPSDGAEYTWDETGQAWVAA